MRVYVNARDLIALEVWPTPVLLIIASLIVFASQGTHIEVVSLSTGRHVDIGRTLLDEEDEDEILLVGDGQESTYWHPRRSLYMQVRD